MQRPLSLLLAGLIAIAAPASGQQALDLQPVEFTLAEDGGLRAAVYLGSEDVLLELERQPLAVGRRRVGAPELTVQTYAGTLAGEPASRVAATVRDGRLRALVWRAGSDRPWWILPAETQGAGQPETLYTAAPEEELARHEGDLACGVADLDLRAAEPRVERPGSGFSSGTLVAEIVAEADYEYVQAAGSQQAAEDEMVETIFFVSAIYEFTFGVRLEIVDLVSYGTPDDPYSEDGSAQVILNEFDDVMIARYAASEYDAAQLFTARNTNPYLGLARCGRVCLNGPNTRSASLVQRRISLSSSVRLSAHEFGHNFGAGHCDEDEGPGGCRSMIVEDCGIMGLSAVRFGTQSIGMIRSHILSFGGCLDAGGPSGPPPVLSAVSPTSIEVLPLALDLNLPVRLVGTDMDAVHLIEFGEALLTLQNVTAISSTQVDLGIPAVSALGLTSVRVANGGGWSAQVDLDLIATDPPRFNAEADPGGFFGLTAQAGGTPGSGFQLLYSDLLTTTTVSGFDVLSSPLQVTAGTLDAVGLATDFWVPASSGTYYMQLVTRDSSGAFFATPVQTHVY